MDISIRQPMSDNHTWIYPWIYPWISISTATLPNSTTDLGERRDLLHVVQGLRARGVPLFLML